MAKAQQETKEKEDAFEKALRQMTEEEISEPTRALYEAISKKSVEAMDTAVMDGANINQTFASPVSEMLQYHTPLARCAELGFVMGIDYLVKKNAKFIPVTISDTNFSYLCVAYIPTSPLVVAIMANQKDAFVALMKHVKLWNEQMSRETNLEYFDVLQFPYRYGCTVLHCAADSTDSEFLKILLKAGVNVNQQAGLQSFRFTPIMRAVRGARWDNIKLLIEAKADLILQDEDGKTVFDHAKTEQMKSFLKDPTKVIEDVYVDYNPDKPLVKQAVVDKNLSPGDILGGLGLFKMIQFQPFRVLIGTSHFFFILRSHKIIDKIEFDILDNKEVVLSKKILVKDVDKEFKAIIAKVASATPSASFWTSPSSFSSSSPSSSSLSSYSSSSTSSEFFLL